MVERVVLLSFVTASISYTVSETRLFKPLREAVTGKSPFFGELLSCGYCLGHWITFILIILYPVRLFSSWMVLDYLLTILVVAWLSGFQWVLMCCLMEKAGK